MIHKKYRSVFFLVLVLLSGFVLFSLFFNKLFIQASDPGLVDLLKDQCRLSESSALGDLQRALLEKRMELIRKIPNSNSKSSLLHTEWRLAYNTEEIRAAQNFAGESVDTINGAITKLVNEKALLKDLDDNILLRSQGKFDPSLIYDIEKNLANNPNARKIIRRYLGDTLTKVNGKYTLADLIKIRAALHRRLQMLDGAISGLEEVKFLTLNGVSKENIIRTIVQDVKNKLLNKALSSAGDANQFADVLRGVQRLSADACSVQYFPSEKPSPSSRMREYFNKAFSEYNKTSLSLCGGEVKIAYGKGIDKDVITNLVPEALNGTLTDVNGFINGPFDGPCTPPMRIVIDNNKRKGSVHLPPSVPGGESCVYANASQSVRGAPADLLVTLKHELAHAILAKLGPLPIFANEGLLTLITNYDLNLPLIDLEAPRLIAKSANMSLAEYLRRIRELMARQLMTLTQGFDAHADASSLMAFLLIGEENGLDKLWRYLKGLKEARITSPEEFKKVSTKLVDEIYGGYKELGGRWADWEIAYNEAYRANPEKAIKAMREKFAVILKEVRGMTAGEHLSFCGKKSPNCPLVRKEVRVVVNLPAEEDEICVVNNFSEHRELARAACRLQEIPPAVSSVKLKKSVIKWSIEDVLKKGLDLAVFIPILMDMLNHSSHESVREKMDYYTVKCVVNATSKVNIDETLPVSPRENYWLTRIGLWFDYTVLEWQGGEQPEGGHIRWDKGTPAPSKEEMQAFLINLVSICPPSVYAEILQDNEFMGNLCKFGPDLRVPKPSLINMRSFVRKISASTQYQDLVSARLMLDKLTRKSSFKHFSWVAKLEKNLLESSKSESDINKIKARIGKFLRRFPLYNAQSEQSDLEVYNSYRALYAKALKEVTKRMQDYIVAKRKFEKIFGVTMGGLNKDVKFKDATVPISNFCPPPKTGSGFPIL